MEYVPVLADLTIVIATLRRPQILRRTLERLEVQEKAAGSFTVIVSSDAAEEDPAAVRSAIGRRPFPVRHVTGELPGVSATRNAGWRAAETDLVLFIGDDMLPEPSLVAEHLISHSETSSPEVAVLGLVRWARDIQVTPFMHWLEHGVQFDYPSIRDGRAAWWHLYMANASLRRSRLEAVGGFDEKFRFGYEELDLAKRLDAIGLHIVYNPAALVEHLHPATIGDWRNRMRTVAEAERQFVAKHPDADPYFHRMFKMALDQPPARGRAARLVKRVPRDFPGLGPRVWGSADAYFAQQLAPAFLDAWERAEAAAE